MAWTDPTPLSSFRRTMYVLIVLLTVAAVYDLWMAFSPEPGDTISEIVIGMSARYVSVTWLAGVVCGHLWWPQFVTLEAHPAERERVAALEIEVDWLRSEVARLRIGVEPADDTGEACAD